MFLNIFCDLIAKIFFCYFYIDDNKTITNQVITDTWNKCKNHIYHLSNIALYAVKNC